MFGRVALGLAVAAVATPVVLSAPAGAVDTPITVTPVEIDFGMVAVGATAEVAVEVENTGASPFGPINMFGGAPPGAAFNASQGCQAKTLAPGASCSITYSFTPTTAGPASDASTFTVSATPNQSDGEDFTVALTGTGQVLSVAPTSADFGPVAIGQSAAREVVVTNVTQAPQTPTITGGAPVDTTNFSSSENCIGATLAPEATCAFTFEFHPTTEGPHESTATIVVDGLTYEIALTGAGVDVAVDVCPASTPEDGFIDVPDTNVHEANIDCAVHRTLVSGTTPTTYDPAANITRGQLASIIRHLLTATGHPAPAATADHFADDEGNTHEDSINRMFELGIVTGTGPSTYAPNDPVRRGQAASILVRAYEHLRGSPLPAGADAFDDDEDSVHEAAINAAATAGLVQGTGGRTFAPTLEMRRDQTATILVRALARAVADDLVAGPLPPG